MPCTNFREVLAPAYTLPCTQLSIVVVPPTRIVGPFSTPTATGTFVRWTLLSTSEPASEVVCTDVRTNTGVFETSASMIASPPTVCA